MFVSELAKLARSSMRLFEAVMANERDWLPPRARTFDSSKALRLVTALGTVNEEAALRIIDMPSLSRTDQQGYYALEKLAALAESDPQRLEELMAKFGVTYSDGTLFSVAALIFDLRLRDREASAALEGLPWVRHGIGEYMTGNVTLDTAPLQQDAADVIQLMRLMEHDPPAGRELFLTLASRGWMENGLMSHERAVLVDLMSRSSTVRERAKRVVAGQFLDEIDKLPWVQPGNKLYDTSHAGQLLRLGELEDDRVFRAVMNRPWVQDGLSEVEEDLIQYILSTFGGTSRDFSLWAFKYVKDVDLSMRILALHMERHDPVAKKAFESLPWIQDAIDPSNPYFGVVDLLVGAWIEWSVPDSNAEDQSGNPFLDLMSKSWVHDGLEWYERDTLHYLRVLPTDLALRLLPMPFLDSVEPEERELVILLYELNDEHPGALGSLLALPEYAGGLTNDNLAEAVEALRQLVP